MPAWDVEVGGVDYSVSIDRTENGKDVVRVGGRVIARPMGAEESERSILVGGAPYLVRRTGPGTFDLEVDQAAADLQARTLETGRTVLAHANAPLGLKHDTSPSRLPWILVGIVVVAFGAIAFVGLIPRYDRDVRSRVTQVLHEMQDPSHGETSLGISLWAKNRRNLDSGELAGASNQFDNWRRAKDIYRQVGPFTVDKVEVLKGEPVPTAIVTFTLEGKQYKIRVQKDRPITWEE